MIYPRVQRTQSLENIHCLEVEEDSDSHWILLWHGLFLISKLIGFARAADKEGKEIGVARPIPFLEAEEKRYDDKNDVVATNERAGSLFAPPAA